MKGGMKSRVLTIAALMMLYAVPAGAQGCAMCYSSAAAASKDGQRALSRAILVMLVPPLGTMTLGIGWAFRYGKKRDKERED